MADTATPHNDTSGTNVRAPTPRPERCTAEVMARALPTLVVLTCLAIVAYWGHRTGWKAPKFSELFGMNDLQREDWCVEHGVPESICIKCYPELAGESGVDWCKEHGVPESRCTICHPEILTTGIAGDWCREHGVPESNCTLCHPEIAVKGVPPASDSGVSVVATPSGQESPDQGGGSGKVQPLKDPSTCQTHAMRVQFASAESVEKAGVKLGSVAERLMVDTLTANAEIRYDRTRLAHVSSRASGVASWVGKEVGDRVPRGDLLALVDSAQVGRAKAELLEAFAQRQVRAQALERTRSLATDKIAPEALLQEHQAALRESEIRLYLGRQALISLGFSLPAESTSEMPEDQALQLLGVPESIRERLEASKISANLLPITSPLGGVLIERNIVAGEIVETSLPLFVVADTSRMWIMIDVPQSFAGRIAIGQRVRFSAEPSSDEATFGAVAWKSTAVDEQTRTVKVRADVENPDGRLLAGTFGQATITFRESPTAIAVPDEAVQWEGCCHLVFVRLADTIFQPRKIKVGVRSGGFTEILVGTLPGEVVATTGSHVLKSELLKSNLGAGCTCE